jgi:glycosidase
MRNMANLLSLGALLGLSTAAAAATADWQGQVIYQVMPDRFSDGAPGNNAGVDRADPGAWHGGDLNGLTAKLNYIQNLGATSVWLTPIYLQPPGRTGGATGYHGYWPWDFQQVDPHYGTLDDFKGLVEAAHAAKLRVVLDQVINHYGYDAPAQRQHPDWFHPEAKCKASGQ